MCATRYLARVQRRIIPEMRRLFRDSCAILAALPLLAAAAAPVPADFVGRFNAATAAYHAKDYERMEVLLRAALELRPGHPTATYNLAAARALRGQSRRAI